MPLNDTASTTISELDLEVNDLGPLAWVLDELRKSLDTASKALKRFVRDQSLEPAGDPAAMDTTQLRLARGQLHQAVGALQMVGLGSPAHVLLAMEAAVQKFIDRPRLCTEDAATKLERASFALIEYLDAVLAAKPVSPLGLFSHYRDVQQVAGADRVHPADLWSLDWQWREIAVAGVQAPRPYDAAARARLDQAMLRLIKGDATACADLQAVCLGFAAAQSERQPNTFWRIAAGFFEALARGLVPADLYVKRAASRILLQYATLARGESGVSDRLANDLLFFCAQAVPPPGGDLPALSAVRDAYGLGRHAPVDYDKPQFGRYDPAVLAQARKRMVGAKESWTALTGGDLSKMRTAVDQFGLVSDSLLKLHAPSAPLAQALTRTMEFVQRGAAIPSTELAMEMATSVLFLEAAFEDLDPADPQLVVRTTRLANRLDAVCAGGRSQALEPWMEELYRRVSDRQTMGSVVGELRSSLGEIEKSLDQFFRNTEDKASLRDVPGQLAQMRGVLSVLGLDQASQAVLAMRDSIEKILTGQLDAEQARARGTFDKLGTNLGALGFLIDMLNYQPALAKKLFVYDAAQGELKPLMGRVGHVADQAPPIVSVAPDLLAAQAAVAYSQPEREAAQHVQTTRLDKLAIEAALAGQAELAQNARQAAQAITAQDEKAAKDALTQLSAASAPVMEPLDEDDIGEDDLRDIFLEEAREVVETGKSALAQLAANPGDQSMQTTLRRSFHTLKGSSRMVGLNEFGEAAWAMEQVFNAWLADPKPMDARMQALAEQSMSAFELWAGDIEAQTDEGWSAEPFKRSAEAMRLTGELLAIQLPMDLEDDETMKLSGLKPLDMPFDLSLDLDQTPAAPAEPSLVTPVEPPATAVAEPLDLSFDEPAPALVDTGFQSVFDTPADGVQSVAPAQAIDELMNLGTIPDDMPALPPEPAQGQIDVPDFQLEAGAPIEFDATEPALLDPDSPAVEPVPAANDFDINFDLGDLSDAGRASGQDAAGPLTFDAAAPLEIEGIDLDSLAALSGGASQPKDAIDFDLPGDDVLPDALDIDFGVGEPPLAAIDPGTSEDELLPDAGLDAAMADERVKVIGDLQIGLALYNVYLNEADEWSRRLVTELAEWSLELHRPLPDAAVALAHSLAGSSATVGFEALSELARLLEHALQHAQSHRFAGTELQAEAFNGAAEDIQRLLHQFAAGFLKAADEGVLQGLRDVLDELPLSQSAPLSESLSTEALPSFSEIAALEPTLRQHVAARQALDAPAAAAGSDVGELGPRGTQAADEASGQMDIVDPDLFPIFEEEAAELLPQLGGALRQWTARPDNQSARMEALRALHTLKGSARLAGAMRLGDMAHAIESEIEQMGSHEPASARIEPLLGRFDAMQAGFDALRRSNDTQALPPPVSATRAVQAERADEAGHEAGSVAPVADPDADASRAVRILAPSASTFVARNASNQVVRVRSQLLDRMVNQAGEVMISRTRLEADLGQLRNSLGDLTGNLDRLRHQLRDIELQAESQMQTRLAQAKDSANGFDPLEFDRFTRVQELTRMMAESVNDVATVQRTLQRTVESTEDTLIAQARQTRDLQRDLLRTRMVEFDGISERLYRLVRQASKESGKQVRLDINGGSIELDRGVLERMTPAFEHLLRNCVAHGIESPEARTGAGKDPTGQINIDLRQAGNDISIEFRDDGAGLDVAAIGARALASGLVQPGHVVTPEEAVSLIFMPGFSTAGEVTELSGRGIGMDVVRSEVNALGGRIETDSDAGKGSRFTMVLPLTTAVTQVVMLRAGAASVGVPANLVESVRRASPRELQLAYNSGAFEYAGEQVPFYWSGALLQISARTQEAPARTIPVVVFRSAAQRLAMHVDEVLGNQEVVVKNLGPQLSRLPGLAGMTVLASGAVAMMYNPVALAAVYGETARRLSADHAEPHVLGDGAGSAVPLGTDAMSGSRIPLVMVVDDSITVRRVTQRLLLREGYRVVLAADGLQALEKLQEERPAVVLSDIEMPRMDGFDLARNIRADARLRELPIVMITSRIASKHRDHAMELGVNHYLGKPYSEEELLGLVRQYCAGIPAVS